jgi:uncharacterized protein YciI
MIFVCIMEYVGVEAIVRVRSCHRDYMYQLIAEGKVIAAGSTLPDGEAGLFLYEADSLQAAESMVAQDPYIQEGAISTYRLRQYEIHGVNPRLLRVTNA